MTVFTPKQHHYNPMYIFFILSNVFYNTPLFIIKNAIIRTSITLYQSLNLSTIRLSQNTIFWRKQRTIFGNIQGF